MNKDFQWAYFILRLSLGVDILGHGLIRLIGDGQAFRMGLIESFANSIIPDVLVHMTGTLLPPLEFIVGLFLILGYRLKLSLLVGSFTMIALIFGASVIQNWTAVSIQLLHVLVYCILIAFRSYNFMALDLIFSSSPSGKD